MDSYLGILHSDISIAFHKTEAGSGMNNLSN